MKHCNSFMRHSVQKYYIVKTHFRQFVNKCQVWIEFFGISLHGLWCVEGRHVISTDVRDRKPKQTK